MTSPKQDLTQFGFIVPDWPAPDIVKAGCTTRYALQGVSLPPFHTLNVANHVGDNAQHVAANRQQLPFPGIAWLKQTHSVNVAHIQHLSDCQADIAADASVTTQKNITCAVMTADCLPILLCDKNGAWVAAIHAGWRGLAAGIIEKALVSIEHHVSTRGFSKRDILAWIGPAIGQQAFEVGDEVKRAFASHTASNAFRTISEKSGKYGCDLNAIARDKMLALGVSDVFGGDYCTHADEKRFFSHRRDAKSKGTTGRMVSMICLQTD